MSKNIPKPIIRIGYSKKNGSIDFEIDGNKVKNMTDNQLVNLFSSVNEIKTKLHKINNKRSVVNGGILTEKQYSEIEELCKSGKKLSAVKCYKDYTGASLYEAKLFVEEIKI